MRGEGCLSRHRREEGPTKYSSQKMARTPVVHWGFSSLQLASRTTTNTARVAEEIATSRPAAEKKKKEQEASRSHWRREDSRDLRGRSSCLVEQKKEREKETEKSASWPQSRAPRSHNGRSEHLCSVPSTTAFHSVLSSAAEPTSRPDSPNGVTTHATAGFVEEHNCRDNDDDGGGERTLFLFLSLPTQGGNSVQSLWAEEPRGGGRGRRV